MGVNVKRITLDLDRGEYFVLIIPDGGGELITSSIDLLELKYWMNQLILYGSGVGTFQAIRNGMVITIDKEGLSPGLVFIFQEIDLNGIPQMMDGFNTLSNLVPLSRNSVTSQCLPIGEDTWSGTVKLHKLGGVTFADDYSVETPNAFQGSTSVEDLGGGVWRLTMNNFQSVAPDEDVIVSFKRLL